jgi:phosphatidylserine/phosphatidylglycerophosphate/cardiolipin synthase-like enzyme
MPRPSIVLALASFLAACSSHPGGSNGETPGGDGGGSDGGGADEGGSAIDGGAGSLITEPDQGMQPVYDFMSSATKTLDMTMYELVDTQATALLTKAAANGVTVRVILDQNDEKTDNTPAYDALSAANVQVHWANPTYACTHQKTITVDGTTSAVMTLNFASEDYKTSRDFAVITTDAADVAAIETVFEADFNDAAITPPNGDNLVWSPTNSQTAMVGVINGAKASLLVENEEMSDSSIVSALSSAASRGVDVEVIMEDSSSYQTEFKTLASAGAKLATYAHAAIYIHAKIMLADYGTSSAQVFVGSENFSHASLTENRELGLITTDPAIMTSLHTTLTGDFTGGTPFSDATSTIAADAGASD